MHLTTAVKVDSVDTIHVQLEAIQRWLAIWRVWLLDSPARIACVQGSPVCRHNIVYKTKDVRFESFIKIFFSTMTSIKNSLCAFLAMVKIYTRTKT